MFFFKDIIDKLVGDYKIQFDCPKCGKKTAEIEIADLPNKGYSFRCNNCGFYYDSWNLPDQLRELINNNQIDKAVNLLSYYHKGIRLESEDFNLDFLLNFIVGDGILEKKSDYKNARKYIERAILALKDTPKYYVEWRCMYDMYLIHKNVGEITDARKCLLAALEMVSIDEKIKIDGENVDAADYLENQFKSVDDEYMDFFLKIPYNERRVIFIMKNIYSLNQKHFSILSFGKKLAQLSFPMGHPKVNEMYIAHPLQTNRYYPIENYQLELIEEKVREFCWLAQSLGATEINIDCLNSNSTDSTKAENYSISGGLSYEGNNVIASNRSEYSKRLLEEISRSVSLHQTYNPHKPAALPSDLIWFRQESSWQQLYKQRMEGSLLTHEERIETKKTQVVDSRELNEIKGELKTLYAGIDLAFEKTEESKFEQQENAVLAISVKFAPLSQLTGEAPTTSQESLLTSNEQKYIDEVKECLEDGGITKTGRRLLNMQRERLGISETRAAELEASLSTPQLTDEEKEYLEAYQEANENGQISDKERRMLNRLRNMLGITEERAKEIEK